MKCSVDIQRDLIDQISKEALDSAAFTAVEGDNSMLKIEDKLKASLAASNINRKYTETIVAPFYDDPGNFYTIDPSASLVNRYLNSYNQVSELNSFAKEENAPLSNDEFKKQLLSYLQKQDIVNKKEFPAGSGNFYIKKTQLGQDPKRYDPESVVRANLRKIEAINQKYGVPVITTRQVGNGLVVHINTQLSLFDKSPEDVVNGKQTVTQGDIDYINQHILTENTGQLIENSYLVAEMLNNQNTINISSIIYKHQNLLSGVTTHIHDEAEWTQLIDKDGTLTEDGYDPKLIGGFYDAEANAIHLNKAYLNSRPVETVLAVINEELFHALTVQPLHKAELKLPMNAIEKEFAGNVNRLFDYYKSHSASVDKTYRFSNSREFLVAMIHDERFKSHLRDIDEEQAIKGEPGFFKRIIDNFVKAVLKFLGIKTAQPITDFDVMTTQYLNQYLSQADKVEGLVVPNQDLFSTARDVNSEKEALRTRIQALTDADKNEVKTKIDNFLNYIKSIGNSELNKYDVDIKNAARGIINQATQLNKGDIDQVDYFFNFTNEIGRIFNVLTNKALEIQKAKDATDDDKLKFWSRVMSTASLYDTILDEMNAIKVNLLEQDPLAKQIGEITAARKDIETGYSNSVLKILAPMIAQIQAPATAKALEIYDREIDHLKRVIKVAEKGGDKNRIKMHQKELEKKIKQRNDEYNIDAAKAESWLRGHMGDSNMLTSWIEAAAVNPNILISSLSKYTKDSLAEITGEVLNAENKAQTEVEHYSKNTGRSINSIQDMYEPLIEKYNIVTDIDEEGKPVTKEKYTLKGPWKRDYIGVLQEFTIRGGKLNTKLREEKLTSEQRKEVEQQIEANREKRAQFIKDYMERPYKDEVHDALDLYHKDLGGFTAAAEFKQLYQEMRDLENEVALAVNDDDFAKLNDLLQEKNFEIKRLRSTYEKDPDSKQYKIAELMNERDKKMNQYFEYILTNSGRAKFEHEKSVIEQQFTDGKITESQRNFWYQQNTQNTLSDTYWKAKMGLIGQMNDILGELGAAKQDKNEDLGKLYNELREITKPFRDLEGIINGNKFNDKQVGDVKDLEEKIEKLKDQLPNMFGLSKVERVELANIYERLADIEEKLQDYQSPKDKQALLNEEQSLKERVDEISSKKKQFKNKKLLDQYFQLLKQLGELDISGVTHYYDERYNEELQNYANGQSIDDLPTKFTANDVKYEKIDNVWYGVKAGNSTRVEQNEVERAFQLKKAQDSFENSDWYKANHILKTRWEKNTDYNPENPFSHPGSWVEAYDALYIWKQTTPSDHSFTLKNEPSLRYKTRVIKPEYRNTNYKKSVDGYNVPRKEGAKDDKYVNKEYLQLQNSGDVKDQASFRFLNYLTELYFKSQEDYPMSARTGYDLPSVRKSGEERRQASTIGEHARGWIDNLSQYFRGVKDQVAPNEQDKDILHGYIDNIGGMIPAKLVGDIDIEDQSIDLMRSIGMFHVAALQRRQLVKAYPFAKALYDIASDKKNTPVKKDKNGFTKTVVRKFLKKGTEAAKHIEGESQVATQLNEMIKTMYFGERIKDQPGAKQINSILGVGAKLMLGLNVGSMIQNFANAKIQSILETESAIGKNFSMRSWAKGEAIYNTNLGGLIADAAKYGNKTYINQFIDFFGGINFDILTKFDNSLAYKQLRQGLGAVFMPTEVAEKELSSVLFISIGLETKVNRTINGKTTQIPLYEAFENDAEGNFVPKQGVEFTKAQKEDFMARVNNSARRINGEYGKMDTITAQKTIAGRLLLFMDKFFVPFFMNRFGKRRLNVNEGIQDDGFWRLFFSRVYTDLTNYQFNVVSNWQYYNPSERAAVKKTMTEIGISISLMCMIAAMGGGNDPEDINANSTLVNNMIYILKGIKHQNEQFMLVPGLGLDDIAQRIKNPLPIATKLIQSLNLLQDMAYLAGYPMGLTEKKDIMYPRKTGWHEAGDYKVFSTIGRLLGSPNKLHQLLHPDVALKNLNAYRIR